MLIALLGSVGFGLVWGWLLGLTRLRLQFPLRTALALLGATLLPALEVLLLAGWLATGLFLGAALLALFLHLGWLRELQSRFPVR